MQNKTNKTMKLLIDSFIATALINCCMLNGVVTIENQTNATIKIQIAERKKLREAHVYGYALEANEKKDVEIPPAAGEFTIQIQKGNSAPQWWSERLLKTDTLIVDESNGQLTLEVCHPAGICAMAPEKKKP